MSENNPVYSIQRTYILTHVLTPEREIITCDQRIDIPTIEPLPNVHPLSTDGQALTVTPCIELAGAFLNEFNLTFETNEGLTVLPITIHSGDIGEVENPYIDYRYVLVLPRGTTGVKSCKLIHKATGKEVQHNLTFGIMPPPYNYDNALFGYSIGQTYLLYFAALSEIRRLKLASVVNLFGAKKLPKNQGEQIIKISNDMLYFTTVFSYRQSSEETVHRPVIKIHGIPYTLSLNKASNYVVVDLLMRMITVSDSVTGEVMQQFQFPIPIDGVDEIGFNNFDDISFDTLDVEVSGRPVV